MSKFALSFIGLFCVCVLLYCETLAEYPSNFHEENSGSAENPFLISNLGNLRWLSETIDVWGGNITIGVTTINHIINEERKFYFRQTADIDASETKSWDDGNGFNPVGVPHPNIELLQVENEPYPSFAFSGHYDGGGFLIKNIFISDSVRPSPFNMLNGFFGRMQNASISNIRLVDILIIETNDNAITGALCGLMENSTVVNSSATGVIIKNGGTTGGLIGFVESSLINNSYSEVHILSNKSFLMMVISKFGYTIPDEVTYTGGLIGNMLSSQLINTYFIGFKNTRSWVPFYGDLVGGMGSSEIRYSYSINIGDNRILVYDHAKDVAGPRFDELFTQRTLTTGIRKRVTERQMQSINTFTRKGWDFEYKWKLNVNINNGFPYLRATN